MQHVDQLTSINSWLARALNTSIPTWKPPSDVAVLLARRLQSRVVVGERLSHARVVVDPLVPRRAPHRVLDVGGARAAVAVDLLDLGAPPAALGVVDLDLRARLDPAQAVAALTLCFRQECLAWWQRFRLLVQLLAIPMAALLLSLAS